MNILNQLYAAFNVFMKYYKIPKRMPPELFKNIINENDLVVVILEHIDYLLKLKGKNHHMDMLHINLTS